jgi:hypothetical protein
MAAKKKPADEGVALNLTDNTARFPDGVPVAVPEDASTSESKSTAKSAATTKEK